MNQEPKSAEIIFKCYLPDNEDDVWLYMNASKMYRTLHEIDQTCRSVIKYDDMASEDKCKFAESIRQLVHGIDMDMIN